MAVSGQVRRPVGKGAQTEPGSFVRNPGRAWPVDAAIGVNVGATGTGCAGGPIAGWALAD